MSDEVRKRAVLYSLMTAVEAVMNIVAMLVKDMGKQVEDDCTNISKLLEEGVVDEGEAELLRKYNGLRNAIARHYIPTEALMQLDELYGIAVKLVKAAERLLS
jgi:uncharacterized protein YutE (UPF0331/DUF86 family)